MHTSVVVVGVIVVDVVIVGGTEVHTKKDEKVNQEQVDKVVKEVNGTVSLMQVLQTW